MSKSNDSNPPAVESPAVSIVERDVQVSEVDDDEEEFQDAREEPGVVSRSASRSQIDSLSRQVRTPRASSVAGSAKHQPHKQMPPRVHVGSPAITPVMAALASASSSTGSGAGTPPAMFQSRKIGDTPGVAAAQDKLAMRVEITQAPPSPDAAGGAPAKRSDWFHENLLIVNVFTLPTSLFLSIMTSVVVMLYALGYLGVLWDPQSHIANIRVGFVNADAGFDFSSTPPPLAAAITAQFKNRTMGQVIQSTLLAPDTPSRNALDWIDLTSENLSHQDAIDRVERNEFWNIVYIPANASNVFLRNFNLDGRPSSKLTYMYIEDIYDQARQLTVASFTTGAVNSIFRGFGAAFNEKLLAGINTPNATVTVNPITFFVSGTNLHPVRYFGQNFSTYIICLVLWLGGLVTVSITQAIFDAGLGRLREAGQAMHLMSPVRIVISCQLTSFSVTLLHAFTAWGIYCAFNNSATSGFNPDYSSFTVLLYMWFIAACFHSFASFFIMTTGKDRYGLFLSLLLILQMATSSSILDPDIMPPFAHVTYGLPFHYAVRSMKCMLLSSSCHDMGKNTAILAAWYIGMSAVTTLLGSRVMAAHRNKMHPETKPTDQNA